MSENILKKRLAVHLSDQIVAFENGSVENRSFLHPETGEIISINYGFTEEELKEEIDGGFVTRYLEILFIALSGNGAFRRFKDVLLNYQKSMSGGLSLIMEKWKREY